MEHSAAAGMNMAGQLEVDRPAVLGLQMKSVYHFEAFDKDGNLKWVEEVENLVTNAGLNDLLDKYFKGSAYTAAFYVGLKGAGSVAAGDTLASHGGWTEVADYTGTRKALTLGSVSGQSVDNSGSPASFAIETGDSPDSVTVAGGFVASVASGTSGVLYGAADFASNRTLESGDTLNVTVTLTAAAA